MKTIIKAAVAIIAAIILMELGFSACEREAAYNEAAVQIWIERGRPQAGAILYGSND